MSRLGFSRLRARRCRLGSFGSDNPEKVDVTPADRKVRPSDGSGRIGVDGPLSGRMEALTQGGTSSIFLR